MFDPRRNRILSKSKPNPSPSHSFLSTKKALQKLSLSFYGLDTIKKTKQIILDDCQLFPSQGQVGSIMQMISQEKKRYKKRGMTAHKNTTLKIDTLFLDEKMDQFQFVTTNASQLEHRERADTKKKVSRSNSVKIKDKEKDKERDKENERGRKDVMDVYSARCKTAKCISRKGKVMEKVKEKKK